MPFFSYRARDINGVLVTGQLEAPGIETIRDFLSDQDLIPISINKASNLLIQGLSLEVMKQNIINFFNTVKPEELMLFTLQFHTLFKAGMNMESILSTLANQTTNQYFGNIILRIKTDVANGSSLSQAFAKHPHIFPDLYTQMLATGEEAGILESVLEKLSNLMEKDIKLKSSIKSAMLYPKIVFGALIIASIILLNFVIPKFKDLYSSFGSELPLPTRILVGLSMFTKKWFWLIAIVSGGLYYIFQQWAKTPKGRLTIDRFKLRVPIFGTLNMKVANARFAHILGALYRAGIPVIRALAISAKTIGNEAFTRDVLTVQTEVEKGKSIAESMRSTKFFNPLLVEATAIGEKTGALDEMYHAIGSHYDVEVNQMVDNLSTLLEPMLLLIIMGMVTLFALATLLPMWNLASVVKA